MPDKSINCSDCGNPFIFSEGEQDFYATKGFSPPKRCKPCREKRRSEKYDKNDD